MIDLSRPAGFPLWFDAERMDVQSGADLVFRKEARRYQELQGILACPMEFEPTHAIYWNYKLENAGRYTELLSPTNLTLGLVMLPALKIGSEYVKTHGHYHSAMPGSQFGYPEVYTLYFGTLLLYMQRRASKDSHELDDCVLYKMRPGCSIMIPPGYAHILINPSGEAALMAGLYCMDSVHQYQMVIETRGGGYYFVEQDENFTPIPNPHYQNLPPLREVDQLAGTRFCPPNVWQPLWTSFIENPEAYRFLASSTDAQKQFSAEDLKL